MRKLILLLSLGVFLAGCKSDNPGLTGEPPPPKPPIDRPVVEQTADGLEVTHDSAVDILFVIDDSTSMKAHQEKLSKNIKEFVDKLAEIQAIDFHIGYTVSHDESRYGGPNPVVPQFCPNQSVPNWEPAGSLRPMPGLNGRRYVTREDDFNTILRNSLDPNKNRQQLLKERRGSRENPDPGGCNYGPEQEELFSPILELLRNSESVASANSGFRRDGALFVVILISDAKSADVNRGYTPEFVLETLVAATGQNQSTRPRFRVITVGMKPGVVMNETTCKPDPAYGTVLPNGATEMNTAYGRPVKDDENPLAVLARYTQQSSSVDQVLSICDADYGKALAEYGTQIQQDALQDIQIPLPRWPQSFEDPKDADRNLKVFIGDKELPQEFWRYNSQSRNGQGALVTVFGQKVPWTEFPNEKIRVTYVPVDVASGTARPH